MGRWHGGCKVMLMVITCISLIPMDRVEKHPRQSKWSSGAKSLPWGRRPCGVLEPAGLGNVLGNVLFLGKGETGFADENDFR